MSPSASSDDVDAGEGQALEQAGRVFLVATEAVQRLGEDDIESSVQRIAHQRLKSRREAASRRTRRGPSIRRRSSSLGVRRTRGRRAVDRRSMRRADCPRSTARRWRLSRLHLSEGLRESAAQFQLEALAAACRAKRSNERAKRRVGAVSVASVVLRMMRERTSAASRSWSSSFGHDTPAHSERRCRLLFTVNGRAERISRRIDF